VFILLTYIEGFFKDWGVIAERDMGRGISSPPY